MRSKGESGLGEEREVKRMLGLLVVNSWGEIGGISPR